MSEFRKEIIEIFKMMLTNQQRIISLLEERQEPDINDPNNWLTPEQAMKVIPVCVRTLYNLRKDPEVIWRKTGRLCEYFKPSLSKVRNKYIK